jgi:hypothetical protein
MASLKSFIPSLSRRLGVSPAALYERQRALVRLGVLHGKKGRGPGSGVKLSADAVAVLLASLLATDSLSEVADTIPLLALKPVGGRCPITNAATFGEALSYLLSSESGAVPHYIKVTRKRPWEAEISEPMNSGEVSAFAPLTIAERSILEAKTEPREIDEDAPFDSLSEYWPRPGITTVAEYELMALIGAFQHAIGKGVEF